MKIQRRYLLVTHIPFALDDQGSPLVDGLWARDLMGLAKSTGPIHVVAPQLASASELRGWGPNVVNVAPSTGITFRGFPPVNSWRDALQWLEIRRVLREEVENAGIVHTSNLFPPYLGLAYAHDLAVRLGKKTLFVIAEDFHDMLSWEWVRTSRGLERWSRERTLRSLDRRVRQSAASASLTLMHTPASVERYRLSAARSYAIRQPGHELDQVIPQQELEGRLDSLHSGRPLNLVAACRHSRLKGLDLLVHSIALLVRRGVPVRASFYGQGPETGELRQLASTLGVAAHVEFPGALPAGPMLDTALRNADLFLMPHRTNDFGRAFFDAMTAGLPVLAFRTPASADTVYDGVDGFLSPLDDVQALAERIALLDRERTRLAELSRGARQRAHDNTREEWFRLRAEWVRSLFEGDHSAAA